MKNFTSLLICIALLCPVTVYGKGSSSGSKSSSSKSSSSSKPSSSGSKYSSGSSSKPKPSSSFSSPSSKPSSGSKYSSSNQNAVKPKTSFDRPATEIQKKQEPIKSSPYVKSAPPAKIENNKTNQTSKYSSSPTTTVKPKTSFDHTATAIQQREGAKDPVKQATPPLKPINPSDFKPAPGTPASKRFDSQAYASTRQKRETTVFNNYTVNQPRYQQYHHRYNDGMNTFFWLWLLDHPQHQAQYLYNYESSLDKERIAELKSKNAALEDDIRKLEQNKTPKDLKNTKFADVDPDLMWTAEKVAVTEAVQPEEHRVSENVESGSSTLIWGILAVAAFIVSFILLFVIDWGGNE